jgi:DNA-directed RNA polymerase specialized sigma24 family protein
VGDTNRALLRRILLADYRDFFDGLKRRLGSADLAGEALQETFLQLDRVPQAKPLHRPKSYLYRIAVNIAIDRRRAEARRLTCGEVESLINIVRSGPQSGADCRGPLGGRTSKAGRRRTAPTPP